MSQDFQIQSRCIDVLAEVTSQHGTLEGRVRIQKIMYLLRRSAPQVLDGVNFFYYHYGPFSSTIVDSINGALSWRVLEQRVQTFKDDKQRYEYVLGTGAAESAEPLDGPAKAAVTRVVNMVKDEHWRTLELAATIDFLQQSENISPDAALERSLELKPLCIDYKAKARALLERLRLPPLQERSIVRGH